MGTLSTDYLQNRAGTVKIPVRELETRVIQYYQAEYTGGSWNPNNSYNWIPGAYRDFTPRRTDSRIKYTCRIPYYWSNASHAISHWRFYAAGAILYTWSESATYIENGRTFEFEVPSWGTSSQRIGITLRSYSNDNHEVRMYGTRYWNGGGSTQNSRGHLMIEEILY